MTKKETKSLAEELAAYDEKIRRLQEQIDNLVQKKNETILKNVTSALEENEMNLQELLGLIEKRKQPFSRPEITNRPNNNENKGEFNQ
ncbi:MAG: hypothetical protein IJ062_02945 [Firmicutes bacterium]|nr:hypothetical protein [Bacillota bacterium]